MSELEQTQYNVVFKGQLLPGVTLDEARHKMATAFNLGEPKLSNIFSGKSVILKAKISLEEAERFVQSCAAKAGIACLIDPPPPASAISLAPEAPGLAMSSAEPELSQSEPPEDGRSHPGTQDEETKTLKCPFCQTSQPDYPKQRTQLCIKCGEIIEKPKEQKQQDPWLSKLMTETAFELVPLQDTKQEEIECPECGHKERVAVGTHTGKCSACQFDIAAYRRKQEKLQEAAAEKERLRSVYAKQAERQQRESQEAEERRQLEALRAKLLEEVKAEYGLVENEATTMRQRLLSPKFSLLNGLVLFTLAGGIGFLVALFLGPSSDTESASKPMAASPQGAAATIAANMMARQAFVESAATSDAGIDAIETMKSDTVDQLLAKGNIAGAERLTEQFDDPTEALAARYKIAQAYKEAGQPEKAQAELAKAQQLREGLSSDTAQVEGLLITGSALQSMGDARGSQAAFRQAVDTSRRINDPVAKVDSLGQTAVNLKINQEPIKEVANSDELFEEVLDIAVNVKDAEQRLQALIRHGRHLWNAGKLAQAQKIFVQVREGALALENADSRDRIVNTLAKEQIALKARDEALLSISELANPSLHDERLLDILHQALQSGRYPAAAQFLDQARTPGMPIEGRAMIAEYQARGNLAAAADGNFTQAKQQAMQAQDPAQRVAWLSIVAKHQANAGLIPAAEQTFLLASTTADQIDNPVKRRDALAQLADNQSKAGFFKQSMQTTNRIEDLATSAQLYRDIADRQQDYRTIENLGRIQTADTGAEELYFLDL